MWKLNQTKQCNTCPWRKDSKVKNIPNYCPELHKDLQDTIADEPPVEQLEQLFDSSLDIMLCHYSGLNSPKKNYCIGWVHNQLGIGNNIWLRLHFMTCENGNKLEVIGEQVKTFKNTFK